VDVCGCVLFFSFLLLFSRRTASFEASPTLVCVSLSLSLQRLQGGNEAYPRSHTCFFTIDLPLYTNLASMTEKVKYAIMNCMAIDTDGGANSGAEDALPDDE
jgi:hypothetical protein